MQLKTTCSGPEIGRWSRSRQRKLRLFSGEKKTKQTSHTVMPSLSCITSYEGKADKQRRKLIRDSVNTHVGIKDERQTARKGVLVEVGRTKSTNSTRQKPSLYLQVHYISASGFVPRPPRCTWTKLFNLMHLCPSI